MGTILTLVVIGAVAFAAWFLWDLIFWRNAGPGTKTLRCRIFGCRAQWGWRNVGFKICVRCQNHID